ncbi:Trk-type K+ transport system, membrane component [Alteribacillus persepolensis]|uniref:Trk-type K+ transport system, membrane component n=1 Tax=Alteribacillus persepolensis TaxID=568899 RepID=A0A1G8BNP9_9BACI|nr:TrkH family potassium uptake protein [Alteribacillus persepolensis]SDH34819.1 Trk-type K+ transport system, membrane component [Alteribacillus persepolensis]
MKKGLEQFMTPFRMIIVSYILSMFLFSFLLWLPVSQQDGVNLTYMESLFTSVSAVSVTGLTVVNVSETLSYTGIFFLALAMQLGGIGIMSIGTFVWMLFGRKINLSQRLLIMVDQNQYQFSGMVKLMRGIILLALAIETVGALILGTYYLQHFDTPLEAYYQGGFAALSAFTNSGFDVTGQSLIPFANDYYVQFVVILLVFAGAIGFPVLLEVKEYFRTRGSHFKFSLFTKITVTTYFLVFIFGVIGIWLLEKNMFYADMTWHQQFFFSVFNSATARSAGLSTMDIGEYTLPTLLFISSLMIIGASPSSVGGGIRTTTIAVMFLTIRSFALGKSDVKVFGREIHPEDKQKAFIVLSFFLFGLFAAVMMISALEQGNSKVELIDIIFETSSAFGTCGLSTGITPYLSQPSQILLMFLMFVGRVGILVFLFSVKKKETKSHYKYPTERMIIG